MASQADPNPAIPQPPAGIDGPNTEVGGAAMEADDLEDDEGFAQSTTTSYVTSLASNIRRGIEENGRIYPDYGQHLPSLPMDDQEQDRNDMQHCKFTLIYSGRLFLSPISYSPQNVLDLGTGTGIWAIDMADKYPSASVVGVDIAPIQSPFVPPNCQFEVEDVEADWTWPKSHYDFVHVRELLFAIRDYPRLIAQSFHALKPGGYLELASSVPNVSCDDNSLPPDTAYGELSQVCFDIGDAVGADMRAPTKWRRQLEDAGFVDVHETVFKVPTNPWPKDRRMKEIGAFELVQFRDAIEGIFTRGYIEVLKGDPVYLQLKLAQARVEIANRKMHSYILFYNVYGKKPYPST